MNIKRIIGLGISIIILSGCMRIDTGESNGQNIDTANIKEQEGDEIVELGNMAVELVYEGKEVESEDLKVLRRKLEKLDGQIVKIDIDLYGLNVEDEEVRDIEEEHTDTSGIYADEFGNWFININDIDEWYKSEYNGEMYGRFTWNGQEFIVPRGLYKTTWKEILSWEKRYDYVRRISSDSQDSLGGIRLLYKERYSNNSEYVIVEIDKGDSGEIRDIRIEDYMIDWIEE